MLNVMEIKIVVVNGDWIEYKEIGGKNKSGAIASYIFPKQPMIDEIYYVIKNEQYIKGIALKLR